MEGKVKKEQEEEMVARHAEVSRAPHDSDTKWNRQQAWIKPLPRRRCSARQRHRTYMMKSLSFLACSSLATGSFSSTLVP